MHITWNSCKSTKDKFEQILINWRSAKIGAMSLMLSKMISQAKSGFLADLGYICLRAFEDRARFKCKIGNEVLK